MLDAHVLGAWLESPKGAVGFTALMMGRNGHRTERKEASGKGEEEGGS